MSDTKEPAAAPARDFRRTPPAVAKAMTFPGRMSDEFRVHIAPDAYAKMKAHAATTSEVELCGVLIGDVGKDPAGYFLSISAVIEGQGAKNLGAQVTFTHETWSHIHEVKDREYPNQRIVGWYHTHPAFGVFLSAMDMFINENFFSEPYQVAIVIDTVRRHEGCFAWEDGECTPLKRYWAGDDEIRLTTDEKEAPEEKPRKESAAAAAAAKEPLPPARPVSGLMMGTMGILLFVAGMYADQMWTAAKMQQTIQQSLESQLYDTLEHAGLTAMASQDFKATREKLQTVREAMATAPGADAGPAIATIEQQLAGYEAEYGKRPSVLRKQMEDVLTRRHQITERIDTLQRKDDDLGLLVASLYLIRIQETLGGAGKVDMATVPESKRVQIKSLVDCMIRAYPDSKPQVQMMFPGLIEYCYPSAGPESPAEVKKGAPAPPAPDGKTASPAPDAKTAAPAPAGS
jgi:proteasome lid subunit RPN8/RPN11